MATATTVEHSAPQASHVAEAPPRVGSRRISIDANLVAIASLFALAVAAFSYLNSRIDGVATELRGEIRGVNAKVDTLSSEMNARFDAVNARFDNVNVRIDTLSAEMNAKIDKVNDKIDRLSAEVNGKVDRLTDKINELIIAQSRSHAQ